MPVATFRKVHLNEHPLHGHFGSIYPWMFGEDNDLLPPYHSGPQCVPYCLPPDWQTHIALPLLLPNVSIVPVWRQLVARGMMSAQHHGDCTHRRARQDNRNEHATLADHAAQTVAVVRKSMTL